MTTSTEERQERADRWLRQATGRMLDIEPDWWLRMACGQVADNVEGASISIGAVVCLMTVPA